MVPYDNEDSDDGSDAIREAMDEAAEAGQQASSRKPQLGMWGAWIYDDGHPAMGGGVGGFSWFDSRDDLLDYMREYLPFISPTIQHRADAGDVLEKCYAAVDA